jgi:acetolactate synthase small subunit
VVDMSPATIVLEAVASPAKLDSLLAMLPGTCELVRTGRIALTRGAAVITDADDQTDEAGHLLAGNAA